MVTCHLCTWSHRTCPTPDCNEGEASPEGIYWELTGSFAVGDDLSFLIHQKSAKGDKRDSGLEEKRELRECNNWSGWHSVINGAWEGAEVIFPLLSVGISPAAGVSGGILEVGAALGSLSSSEAVL